MGTSGYVLLMALAISLSISTFVSMSLFKRNQHKWKSLLAALLVNAAILLLSAAFLYTFDAQTFHKESNSVGIVAYILFIPVLTWVNYFPLARVKKPINQ